MGYRMWKGHQSKDYDMIDRMVGEQYRVGGVDAWLYMYSGAKIDPNNNDLTKINSIMGGNKVSSIMDVIFGENAYRNYQLEAITIPVVYNVRDATPDLKLIGLMFDFNDMEITVHYNTMMQYIGRKIIPGDVIELPNLRDTDIIDSDKALNKFYVVTDGFRTSIGYSATWLHHIYKIKVKPLTDSPEFDDLIGDNKLPDNPDDPNNPGDDDGSISTKPKEDEIMRRIIEQTDNEMPYIHWTNEHIFKEDNSTISSSDFDNIQSGNILPNAPISKLFVKTTEPVLYYYENGGWSIDNSVIYRDVFPADPKNFDFCFIKNTIETIGYSLYQYYTDELKWVSCVVPISQQKLIDNNDCGFYIHYELPIMYEWKGKGWEEADFTKITQSFTTNDINNNIYNPHDWRESIPPARGDVDEGVEFPTSPQDGQYFYRTDYVPVTLWQFNAEHQSWKQFEYGGRLPWVGANYHRVRYVNNPNKVSIQDVNKPNIVYRKYKK